MADTQGGLSKQDLYKMVKKGSDTAHANVRDPEQKFTMQDIDKKIALFNRLLEACKAGYEPETLRKKSSQFARSIKQAFYERLDQRGVVPQPAGNELREDNEFMQYDDLEEENKSTEGDLPMEHDGEQSNDGEIEGQPGDGELMKEIAQEPNGKEKTSASALMDDAAELMSKACEAFKAARDALKVKKATEDRGVQIDSVETTGKGVQIDGDIEEDPVVTQHELVRRTEAVYDKVKDALSTFIDKARQAQTMDQLKTELDAVIEDTTSITCPFETIVRNSVMELFFPEEIERNGESDEQVEQIRSKVLRKFNGARNKLLSSEMLKFIAEQIARVHAVEAQEKKRASIPVEPKDKAKGSANKGKNKRNVSNVYNEPISSDDEQLGSGVAHTGTGGASSSTAGRRPGDAKKVCNESGTHIQCIEID